METNNKKNQPQGPDSFAAQIMAAETTIALKKNAAEKEENLKRKVFPWKAALSAVFFLAAAFIVYRSIPELRSIRFERQPLRFGSYATDSAADRCINNLWTMAAAMRKGGKMLPRLFCPVSGKAYIISGSKVSCPNPAAHKAKKLYADNKTIIPFLEK